MQMQIQIDKLSTETVILSEYNIKTVVKDYLKSKLYPGEFLSERDGKTYLKAEEEHSRGSSSSYVVREATELDKAIWVILISITS